VNFWIAVQKFYNSATNFSDRAVSTRAFSLLFFALAGLMTIIGLAIVFGVAFPPIILPALILVAFALLLACVVLIDKRHAIKGWLCKKVKVPVDPDRAVFSSFNISYRSVTPPSQDRPPRFSPHA
jgi:hypothetical protein